MADPLWPHLWWHYVPMVGVVIALACAGIFAAYGWWLLVFLAALFACAFIFQVWWIWYDIPRKLRAYKESSCGQS